MPIVKVKIAVAVDAKGSWSASGWGRPDKQCDTETMKDIALEGTEADPVKVYWVEAVLPVPTDEENTVEASAISPAS